MGEIGLFANSIFNYARQVRGTGKPVTEHRFPSFWVDGQQYYRKQTQREISLCNSASILCAQYSWQ